MADTMDRIETTGGRPIACRLSEADQARRGAEIAEQIFADIEERVELADGYAFRFSGEEERFDLIAAFVAAERRCCPFFRFEIVVEPDAGPIWLTLRGEPGVKAFIATELAGWVNGASEKAS